jgi:hypothetical protein
MDMNNETIPPDVPKAKENGVRVSVIEAVVAVLVVALGALVIFGSRKLGSGWSSDGPGPGYFPFYIGLILIVSGLGVLFQSFNDPKAKHAVFVTRNEITRVLQVLIPASLYVGAVQLIGIYVASAVYIALFMVLLGKYSWVKSVVIALIVNVLFFLMFEVWFKVPLFKGNFDLLSGLGY